MSPVVSQDQIVIRMHIQDS